MHSWLCTIMQGCDNDSASRNHTVNGNDQWKNDNYAVT